MENKEIIEKIKASVENSEHWTIYHHLTDKRGNPALMLRQNNFEDPNEGVNIDTLNGVAYVFLDNGTPAEPGETFSIQDKEDLEAMQELLKIVEPFVRKDR